MAKRKELSVEAWRKQLTAPKPSNRALEARFLEQHRFYGGRIHEVTVDAYVAALDQGSDVGTGHSLFLRLFAEYVTALETLGAWGWAIRDRRELPLVLDGLLSYPHNAPRRFYLAVRRNRSRSLVRLLALPDEPRLIPSLRAGFPELDSNALCHSLLQETFLSCQQCADFYFTADEIFRRTHNKAKHGATMFRTDDLTPREFYVALPNVVRKGTRADTARYEIPKFSVNRQMIGALARRTEVIGATIRACAGIASALLQADVLYPRGHVARS